MRVALSLVLAPRQAEGDVVGLVASRRAAVRSTSATGVGGGDPAAIPVAKVVCHAASAVGAQGRTEGTLERPAEREHGLIARPESNLSERRLCRSELSRGAGEPAAGD